MDNDKQEHELQWLVADYLRHACDAPDVADLCVRRRAFLARKQRMSKRRKKEKKKEKTKRLSFMILRFVLSS